MEEGWLHSDAVQGLEGPQGTECRKQTPPAQMQLQGRSFTFVVSCLGGDLLISAFLLLSIGLTSSPPVEHCQGQRRGITRGKPPDFTRVAPAVVIES